MDKLFKFKMSNLTNPKINIRTKKSDSNKYNSKSKSKKKHSITSKSKMNKNNNNNGYYTNTNNASNSDNYSNSNKNNINLNKQKVIDIDQCYKTYPLECYKMSRNFDDYSDSTKAIIRLISLWGHDLQNYSQIAGSFSNKLFWYPGDIDAMQVITIKNKEINIEKLKDLFVFLFINLFRRLLFNFPNNVFIDFKSGVDDRFLIDMPTNPNRKNIEEILLLLESTQVFKKSFIQKLINKIPNNNSDQSKFVKTIKELLHNLATLRWEYQDLLDVSQTGPYISWPNYICKEKSSIILSDIFNNISVDDIFSQKGENNIYLRDSIFSGQRIKLDIYYYLADEFLWKEVTNVFIIKIISDKKETWLTENFNNYRENLDKDIDTYLGKKNLMKASKRLFNRAREIYLNSKKYDQKILKEVLKLSSIHTTYIARISQIKGDLEVLIDIFDKVSQNCFRNKFNNSSLFKQFLKDKNMFAKTGDFTTLKNFGKHLIISMISGFNKTGGTMCYSLIETCFADCVQILYNSVTKMIELSLQEDDLDMNNTYLSNIFSEFEKFKNTQEKLTVSPNKQMNLSYDNISYLIMSQGNIFNDDIFNTLLKKNVTFKPDEIKTLLTSNWFYFSDKYWVSLYNLFNVVSDNIKDLINYETEKYFKNKLNFKDPYQKINDLHNNLKKIN